MQALARRREPMLPLQVDRRRVKAGFFAWVIMKRNTASGPYGSIVRHIKGKAATFPLTGRVSRLEACRQALPGPVRDRSDYRLAFELLWREYHEACGTNPDGPAGGPNAPDPIARDGLTGRVMAGPLAL